MLAGGRSSRMGAPKASLEWHGSTLLRRVGGILERVVDGPVVIVRAEGQQLPRLPAAWVVAEDGRPGRGPLEALAAGLNAVAKRAEVVFVTSTDSPLIHPAFVAAVIAGLRPTDEICIPMRDGLAQPLAAAYRTAVARPVAALLAADELRLGLLLQRCRVRRLEPHELLTDAGLAAADPQLASLVNLNLPGEYAAARARPAPEITVSCPGTDGAVCLRAATVGRAARVAGVTLGTQTWVTVNGRPAGGDPQTPLVDGDAVALGTLTGR